MDLASTKAEINRVVGDQIPESHGETNHLNRGRNRDRPEIGTRVATHGRQLARMSGDGGETKGDGHQ